MSLLALSYSSVRKDACKSPWSLPVASRRILDVPKLKTDTFKPAHEVRLAMRLGRALTDELCISLDVATKISYSTDKMKSVTSTVTLLGSNGHWAT